MRLVIGFAAVALSSGLSTGLADRVFGLLFDRSGFPAWFSVARGLISGGVALLAYYVYVTRVESRTPTEIGFDGVIAETGRGLFFGASLFTLTVGSLWVLGNYEVLGYNGLSGVGLTLGAAISAGVVEEILFRALLFRIFEGWLGSWMALGISALFFGFAHAFNPGATFFSSLAIALEAGILLAAAYMYTKRVWLAIGLHIAWNFVQGGIFGVAVSGVARQGILEATTSGSPLISGGDFGAEASVFAVLFCVGLALYLLTRSKVTFVPPPWREPLPAA